MQNNQQRNDSKRVALDVVYLLLALCLIIILFCMTLIHSIKLLLLLYSARGTRPKPERETREERKEMMESISAEQSATVDELVEACIKAFGWSLFTFI